MSDAAFLSLILQSALRSLLLGTCVHVAVKAARLRDLGAETTIWLAVLLAALAMPVLSLWLPGLDIRLPTAKAVHTGATMLVPSTPSWVVAHAGVLMLAAWAGVAGVGVARLALGLVLTARIHALSQPIDEPWTEGRDIRETGAVDAPLSYAKAILLPLDWRGWSAAKLQAVLAHEDSHVRRGDFFILLLASVHRALFWFSPFAWWLQARLGDLAETASDKAAVVRIADPAGYAEILIEVARRTRSSSGPAMAMARSPGIAHRVDQILGGIPERTLGAAGRLLALAGVLALGLGLAEVRAAATDPAPPVKATVQPAPASHRLMPAPSHHAIAQTPRTAVRHRAAAAIAVPATTAAPAASEEAVSYDPRALLDQPSPVIVAGVLLSRVKAESRGE